MGSVGLICDPHPAELRSLRLSEIRRQCAVTLLDLCKRANAGHIGTSLSCLEILVDLCFHRMAGDDALVLLIPLCNSESG
jgi:transketolase N-terminal domain/subunit